MSFSLFLERLEYDKNHTCLTPGAVYSTTLHEKSIDISISLPKDIDMPDDPVKAKELEVDLHYALEKILARLFKKTI